MNIKDKVKRQVGRPRTLNTPDDFYIECTCGSKIRKLNHSQHIRSKKHKDIISEQRKAKNAEIDKLESELKNTQNEMNINLQKLHDKLVMAKFKLKIEY